jgi:cytokinin dehydrogenase
MGSRPYRTDFGRVVHSRPREVRRPSTVEDVVDAVGRGLPVVARGRAHSTAGQAQIDDGLLLELEAIDHVRVDGERAVAGAGATWRQVLDAALPHGLTPPVLTDYLDLSVGGTLSVGGVGGTTFRRGAQVDNVLALRLVTGDGEVVDCSSAVRPDLFDAARAGRDRAGVIVQATLQLEPAPARVRRRLLGYSDVRALMADQRRLVAEGRFEYVQGQTEIGTHWRYVLEATAYDGDPRLPDGLSYDDIEVEELSYAAFADRMADSVAELKALGEWDRPHPWWSAFLPGAAADDFVAETMEVLTPADLGLSGLALLYPFPRERVQAPRLHLPDDPLPFLFALLRTASPAARSPEEMVAANRALHESARAIGGVRYPI